MNENMLYSEHGIPIRNIWLLQLYASELFAEVNKMMCQTGKEQVSDEIPSIIAEILVYSVRKYLLRGLTQRSIFKSADLHRIRGRVNVLRTAGHQLLDRALVACHFQEPTLNTPRNRLIKAGLDRAAYLTSGELAKRCRDYAGVMYRMGVVDGLPNRIALSKETTTINNRGDKQALAAAKLLLDMAIPDCQSGKECLPFPETNEPWLRKLFEAAIRGFYVVTASDLWDVKKLKQDFPVDSPTEGLLTYIPKMELDICIISKDNQRKVVIDTKFTSLLKSSWYREASLSSAYIYQMYTYLRTQEKNNVDRHATGILLHPAIEKSQRFSCNIQGHKFIFATVNLKNSAMEIRTELLNLLEGTHT